MKSVNEDELIRRKYRNKLAYILIAFHQGVSYISQLAIQYFFKDNLKVEPSLLSTLNSITHLPWAIKPILGLITDLLPIFGYRRKIYILLCGMVNLMSWILMAFYANTTSITCILIFLVNLSLSFCSVLGEAVVVELSKLETEDKSSKAKDFVSIFFLSRTIGELLSSYFKGLFVDIMPLRKIFLIACFIPILIIISGFILEEIPYYDEKNEKTRNNSSHEEANHLIKNEAIHENDQENNSQNNEEKENINLFSQFIQFMCQKQVIIPLAFIILFKSTPSYYDAFFYFITNELKITASDLGKISFCSTIAILIAIWIYRLFLKDFNFKTMITIGTIISFFISFLSFILVLRINLKIGIPDFWMLLFTNSFLSLIGELVLLPILSLACVLCPKNLEGTVYSIFMSSLNFGGILSQLNGSICTNIFGVSSNNFKNLHLFVLCAKILSLLPLPILLCINNKYLEPKEKDDDDIKENLLTDHKDNKNEKSELNYSKEEKKKIKNNVV